jgi:hypothetical protein
MEWLEWLETSGVALAIRESPSVWVYPSVLTLHTIGLGILVGVNAAIDLRLLGFAPRVPVAPLETLFPIMWTGFWINAVSGAALFASQATTKGVQTIFYVKLACVAAGIVNLVLLRRVVFRRKGADMRVPRNGRILAATSLAVWAAAIVAGRLMAYL